MGVAVGVGLGVKVAVGVNVAVGVGVSVAKKFGISPTPQARLVNSKIEIKQANATIPVFFFIISSIVSVAKQHKPLVHYIRAACTRYSIIYFDFPATSESGSFWFTRDVAALSQFSRMTLNKNPSRHMIGRDLFMAGSV